jgi:uncharacterized alpha-E superfamily protein
VAELLILRPDMPRSLTACLNEVNRLVQEINGPRSNELVRRSGLLHGELRYGTIDGIFARGLHEYLSDFLERIYDLGDLINTTYFWSTDELPPAMFGSLPAASLSPNISSSSQMMA